MRKKKCKKSHSSEKKKELKRTRDSEGKQYVEGENLKNVKELD